MMWRVLKLVAVALVGVAAHQEFNGTELPLSHGVARRLAMAPGNIAACYTPFHNPQYPLNGGGADINAVRGAIREDFRIMSQYFTHVRTYYSMHFGIEIAPIAREFGLKLYLGAFLSNEAWAKDDTTAAVRAITEFSDVVEVVLVGNENMDREDPWVIMNKINEIKARAGGDAWRVKYGTVQRANEYLDGRVMWKMQQLAGQLDILGVNVYPCFDNSYDGNRATDMLTAQWNAVARNFPLSKLRLTETGYSTGGSAHWLSPRVIPNLDASQKYYEGVVNWTPPGTESYPKFWFQAFDRRWGDPSAQGIEMELYFGFFNTNRSQKRHGFPRNKGDDVQAPGQVEASNEAMDLSACPLQDNMDFNGNDIGNAPASSADKCFSICNATPACTAFSWSGDNRGTCWLKSSKVNVSYKYGVKSGERCSATTMTVGVANCAIEDGVDYIATDVGSRPAAQADGCFEQCRQWNGCGAFSWTSANGGTCWLKHSKGNTKSAGGVKSSVLKCDSTQTQMPPSAAPACGGIESNVDYTGEDIGNAPAATADQCFQVCASRSGCGAFAWTASGNSGTCWLKREKRTGIAKNGVFSGVKCADASAVQHAVQFENDVDYTGPDAGNAVGKDAYACVAVCNGRSNCKAFTWSNYMGGTCWLKGGKGSSTKRTVGVVSAVVKA